ncbi:N-succinylarginine dihydrolase, partial [Klebsiella pneumoniae]|nr:N-succinylarginine dihydrolase [Klebsiella pneumoniae]
PPAGDRAGGNPRSPHPHRNHRRILWTGAPPPSAILGATFADPRYFAHHAALPQHGDLGDEGAANHNRFRREYYRPGGRCFGSGRRATGGRAWGGGARG